MGTVICQDCQKIIEYYETEKVTTLYSVCSNCNER
ncbi:MAG TPA: GapA-binding peptide SR1P [Bacillota bacterium]